MLISFKIILLKTCKASPNVLYLFLAITLKSRVLSGPIPWIYGSLFQTFSKCKTNLSNNEAPLFTNIGRYFTQK